MRFEQTQKSKSGHSVPSRSKYSSSDSTSDSTPSGMSLMMRGGDEDSTVDVGLNLTRRGGV